MVLAHGAGTWCWHMVLAHGAGKRQNAKQITVLHSPVCDSVQHHLLPERKKTRR